MKAANNRVNSMKRCQVDGIYYSMLFYLIYEIFDKEAFAMSGPPPGSSLVTSDGTIVHGSRIESPEPISQGISITNKPHCYNPETNSYTDCKPTGAGIDGGSTSTLIIGGLVILAAAGAGAGGSKSSPDVTVSGGRLVAAPLSLAPTANDDFGAGFTTDQITSFTTANVLDNDIDPDPTPNDLTFGSLITTFPPKSGTLTVNGDGTFAFDPGSDFDNLGAGEDRSVAFEYTVRNGDASDAGLILITVNGVNDEPNAIDDHYSIDEDTMLFGINVLANDIDIDTNDVLTVIGFTPGLGTVVLNLDNTFDYNPGSAFDYLAAGEYGIDTFTYTVSDGLLQDTATVSFTISGINDAPNVNDDKPVIYTSSTTGMVIGDVKDNDFDPDTPHKQLTVSKVNGAALNVGATIGRTYGDITVNSDGTFTYDLDEANIMVANLAGGTMIFDNFTYELSDNHLDGALTSTADLMVSIIGNNAPTDIMGVPTSVIENTLTTGGLLIGNLTSDDIDPLDHGVFSIPLFGSPDQHKFEITNTNELRIKETYHLNHEAQSSLTVDILVTDMGGAEYVETFTIDVLDVPEVLDAVVINGDDTMTAAEQDDLIYLNPPMTNFSLTHTLPATAAFTGDHRIALADLNEDGHIDMYLTGSLSGLVQPSDRIFFNDGAGNLILDPNQFIANDSTTKPILGDIDGDGDMDAITGDTANTLQIFNNQGDGTFVNSLQTFGTNGLAPIDIEFADFDLDGDLDVAVLDSSNVRIFDNNGAGIFSLVDTFGGTIAESSLAVGEFDAVPGPDIIVTDTAADSRFYFNDGTGDFDTFAVNSFAFGVRIFDATVADFDGDNIDDVFVVIGGSNVGHKLYTSDNDGTFTFTGVQHGTSSGFRIESGDYDGDGDMDVYVATAKTFFAGSSQNEPDEIWTNDGAGVFTRHTVSNEPFNAFSLGFNDLDSM